MQYQEFEHASDHGPDIADNQGEDKETFDYTFSQAIAEGNKYLRERYDLELELREGSEPSAVFFGTQASPKDNFASYDVFLENPLYFSDNFQSWMEEQYHVTSLTGLGFTGRYTEEVQAQFTESVIRGIDRIFKENNNLLALLQEHYPSQAEKSGEHDVESTLGVDGQEMSRIIDNTFSTVPLRRLLDREVQEKLSTALIGTAIEHTVSIKFTGNGETPTSGTLLATSTVSIGGTNYVFEYYSVSTMPVIQITKG